MSQSTSFINKYTCISPIYNKLQRLSAKVYAVWKANTIYNMAFLHDFTLFGIKLPL